MASEKGLAEGATASSAPNNNNNNDQEPLAESPQISENLMCAICLDVINDQVSISSCSHAFCFSCILEWSRNKAVCPICREPFRYLLRKVGDSNFEVYSIGPHTINSNHQTCHQGSIVCYKMHWKI
uniref:RING-type E3 ubiquitin transferase n=1 Tax=Malurus cyaneus samueli TaxID=2593467 RepID=A0A8C5TLS3_9PASS